MEASSPSSSEPAANPRAADLSYLRIVGIAAAIGIPAAFLAAAFLALVHELESWLWNDLPRMLGYSAAPWFLVLGLPIVGALVVIIARRLPGDGGASPLRGLEAGATPPSHVPSVVLAALGSLSFGAILGPEMPVIALGTAVGIAAKRFVKLGPRETAVLAQAGAFSAISALFGGPLVAGLLLLEGGLSAGAALIPVMLPGLVAASVGYLIFTGFGNFAGLQQAGLTVPNLPPYTGVHLLDLLVGGAVGAGTVLAIYAVRRGALTLDTFKSRLGVPLLLIGGGGAIGVIALVSQALGANPNDVLFSGQSSIPSVVGAQSIGLVVLLLVAKLFGYSVSLGTGFRGGPIFPAIFLGVAIAALAVVGLGVSPTLAVAVGTAAGMAAQTRLLIAPLLFADLLVGSAGADTLPASVAAAVTAWLLTRAITSRGLWPGAAEATATS